MLWKTSETEILLHTKAVAKNYYLQFRHGFYII